MTDSFSTLPAAFDLCADNIDSGGGFFGGESSQIPLSSIPTALQHLNLPPDDEQVLNVFKNAASGWASATNEVNHDTTGQFVSREDWRSVCAVLFEHHAEEYAESASDGPGPDAMEDPFEDDDGDAYEDVEEPESDSDEYMDDAEPSPSRRRRPTRRRASSSSSSGASHSSPKKLTARQRKTCLDTYALFFPDVSAEQLPQQRIMIKDVQRLTQLIGDKLKSDEIVEMVEEFSTSPDKSMSFADFGAMMLAARLA
ncbi:hypothetical protein C8F01DRAFT_1299907 [Mycena amicta]|nr:hypothetical protein C8F01DRAFT_1299907 [Mycena amicta]